MYSGIKILVLIFNIRYMLSSANGLRPWHAKQFLIDLNLHLHLHLHLHLQLYLRLHLYLAIVIVKVIAIVIVIVIVVEIAIIKLEYLNSNIIKNLFFKAKYNPLTFCTTFIPSPVVAN